MTTWITSQRAVTDVQKGKQDQYDLPKKAPILDTYPFDFEMTQPSGVPSPFL
jgi:hypothetical protein